MQVMLNQTEIEKAIMDFMHKRINIVEGTQVVIEMKATRGAEGFSAVVDIMDNPEEHAEMLVQEKTRQVAAREEKLEKAGRFLKESTKKAAVEEEADAEEAVETSEPESADSEPEEKPAPASKRKSIFNNATPA